MPSAPGRVRMPHNNRMHSSAALKMTGIWKNTIGYDPYAAEVCYVLIILVGQPASGRSQND